MSVQRLLAGAGNPAELADYRDAAVPFASANHFSALACRRMGTEHLGLWTNPGRLIGDYGPYGQPPQNSLTLHDYFRRGIALYNMVITGQRIWLSDHGDELLPVVGRNSHASGGAFARRYRHAGRGDRFRPRLHRRLQLGSRHAGTCFASPVAHKESSLLGEPHQSFMQMHRNPVGMLSIADALYSGDAWPELLLQRHTTYWNRLTANSVQETQNSASLIPTSREVVVAIKDQGRGTNAPILPRNGATNVASQPKRGASL